MQVHAPAAIHQFGIKKDFFSSNFFWWRSNFSISKKEKNLSQHTTDDLMKK
jgi:hypothetical protein